MRENLLSLQKTAKLIDQTASRLSTGKKVNSALDDAVAFFAAQGHTQRAGDLAVRKDEMAEAIQTIKTADAGISAISDLIASAKSLAQSALATTSTTERASYATQFNAVLDQIDDLAGDTSYKGLNLLDSASTLTVKFNEDGTSKVTITGVSSTSTGLSVSDAASSWAASTNIDAAVTALNTATSTLRTTAQTLSNTLSTISVRQDFTDNMINVLKSGADNLTLADLDEEGANLLMLQTRQALAQTSLSITSQAAQGVLRLF
jgi:flagellin-like hook-associated protein FlgL